MPRVVSGNYRGTVLFAPKGETTRPTTDKVKESLFSILQMRVPGSDFLDLFAGCGQIGIEAVSRGADSCVMVDKGREQIDTIRRNLDRIHESEGETFRIIKAPYDRALETLGEEGASFDIIYMDPPYRMAEKACMAACEIVERCNMLKPDGILLCEHASDLPFDSAKMILSEVRSCSYGLTVITFFKREKETGDT
ncbi:16S rRNA (guanine(966)-N(2))-methyltransferase RsmD [Ruminococcaceae bacterium YRB3002]|nr:16S rRNA (guanine(966)-N(2))-methyltransferase RsmD [Ruminococcaceae bacterium YRB3002]